jgi:hypothetical protein
MGPVARSTNEKGLDAEAKASSGGRLQFRCAGCPGREKLLQSRESNGCIRQYFWRRYFFAMEPQDGVPNLTSDAVPRTNPVSLKIIGDQNAPYEH